MKKSHLIAIFFLGIIVFSTSLSTVMAADNWGAAEDSKLYYWLDSKEKSATDTTIIAQGMVTITVEDIETATLDITLSIDTNFKGTEAITYRDDIEKDSVVYTGTFINMPHIVDPAWPLYYVSILLTIDTLTDAATTWNSLIDFLDAIISLNENLTMTYEMTETSYNYNIVNSETKTEWDSSVKYTTKGVLQSYKAYTIDIDGVKTSLNFDKKLIPLNYPDWYFYIGGGVVIVVILIVVIACCSRKRR